MPKEIVSALVAGALLILATATAQAEVVVVASTFGPGFATGSGTRAVAGTDVVPTYVSPAVSFTPTATVELTTIVLAVGSEFGDSTFDVNLLRDNAGSPGGSLETWGPVATTFPFFFASGTETLTSVPGVFLTAGVPYWLQVAPGTSNTFVVWVENNRGIQAPFAVMSSTGEAQSQFVTTTLAFEVTGSTAPEPASFALLLAGLAGLAAVRARGESRRPQCRLPNAPGNRSTMLPAPARRRFLSNAG